MNFNISYDFTDRNIVITGGAQGIGFQLARDFLQAGASVAIWDNSKEALENARKELSEYSDHLQSDIVDVTDRESCETAANKLLFQPHVLINNAGITKDRSFAKLSHEDFDDVINVNLSGVFKVSKALFEKFSPEDQNKRIINMSSIVALYGNFGQTNYAAAKAGLIGMTKTLARELGGKGFTVNAIAPGFIMTQMLAGIPEKHLDLMKTKIPVGRVGQTSDISNACLFLASADSGYVNGITLSVDGGMIA